MEINQYVYALQITRARWRHEQAVRKCCLQVSSSVHHYSYSAPSSDTVTSWWAMTDRWTFDTLPGMPPGTGNLHTHPFNGPFSRTIQVSQYQKGKTNLDFTEARDSEWQWHQLGHMQVCTQLQTDNHASTPPLSFYRLDALSAAQPTVSKHWRHWHTSTIS